MLIKDIIILEQRFIKTSDLINHLLDISEKEGKLFSGKMRNLFIHFSNIPKLGIYPLSTFDTPIGIYAYPFDYIYEEFLDKSEYSSEDSKGIIPFQEIVPFAGNRKYIIAFSVNNKGIKLLNDFSEDEYKQITNKIISLDEFKKIKEELGVEKTEKIIEKADKNATIDSHRNVGRKFWYFIYNISGYLQEKYKKKISILSRNLFVKLGYLGFVDNGEGIIHKNRLTQAVFFSINTIKNYWIFDNKFSKSFEISLIKLEKMEKKSENIAKKLIEDFKNKYLQKERKEIIEFIDNNINKRFEDLVKLLAKFISEKIININKDFFKKESEQNNIIKTKIFKILSKNLEYDFYDYEKDDNYRINIVPDIIGYGDEDSEFLYRFYVEFIKKQTTYGRKSIFLSRLFTEFLKTKSFEKVVKIINKKISEGKLDKDFFNKISKNLLNFYTLKLETLSKDKQIGDLIKKSKYDKEFFDKLVNYFYLSTFNLKDFYNLGLHNFVSEENAKKLYIEIIKDYLNNKIDFLTNWKDKN